METSANTDVPHRQPRPAWRVLLVSVLLISASAPNLAAERPRIVFSRNAPTRISLYLADANGNNERPLLPATSFDYNASFSKNGKWIVFTSERAGSADIYRMHPDGSELERLTTRPSYDDQGALSPDGRTLVFVSTRGSGTANIWLLDLARRQYTNLTKNTTGNFRPSWSPGGNWIAFSSCSREVTGSRKASPQPDGAGSGSSLARPLSGPWHGLCG